MGRKDLTGKRFGRLFVKEYSHTKNKRAYWVCTCDCGNIKISMGTNLSTGNVKSCGCLRKDGNRLNNFKDLSSSRFGKLIVEGFSHRGKNNNRYIYWLCQCDCGKGKIILGSNLKSGTTRSCGCLHREISSERCKLFLGPKIKHGHDRRKRRTPEYRTWSLMRNRCNNPRNPEYRRYGGRGIVVCEEWGDFQIFLNDMGNRPSDQHSIDRINNDCGYSKNNCKWSLPIEQCNNRRSNYFITYENNKFSLAEWSRRTGLKSGTLRARLDRGWSVGCTLTTPVKKEGD